MYEYKEALQGLYDIRQSEKEQANHFKIRNYGMLAYETPNFK